ncbi:MAG: hypothetical protein LBL59_09025 [Xanthomonadaceae bacterium]|jgi:hypothetical protein|nr:hypothetical protein [Xanthomonadaceae bacterium]
MWLFYRPFVRISDFEIGSSNAMLFKHFGNAINGFPLPRIMYLYRSLSGVWISGMDGNELTIHLPDPVSNAGWPIHARMYRNYVMHVVMIGIDRIGSLSKRWT